MGPICQDATSSLSHSSYFSRFFAQGRRVGRMPSSLKKPHASGESRGPDNPHSGSPASAACRLSCCSMYLCRSTGTRPPPVAPDGYRSSPFGPNPTVTSEGQLDDDGRQRELQTATRSGPRRRRRSTLFGGNERVDGLHLGPANPTEATSNLGVDGNAGEAWPEAE